MYGYDQPGQNAWAAQLQALSNQIAALSQTPHQAIVPQTPAVTQTNMQQSIQIPTVHGLDAAKNVNLPPSSSAIIMDADDIIFNVIITDSNGIKTLKRYRGVEIEEESTPAPIDYVTKTEFQSLSDKVNSIADKLNSQNNNNNQNQNNNKDKR